MSTFEGRRRVSRDEAEAYAATPGKTRHVVDNGDGTFSVVSHIVCEWCDYCGAGGPGPFPAKEDIYEDQPDEH